MSVLDSGFQVSDKGLMEVFRRMEPLIRAMLRGVGGGQGIKYNENNQELASRYLESTSNALGPRGYGTTISDSVDDPIGAGGTGGVLIETAGTDSDIVIDPDRDLLIPAEQVVLCDGAGATTFQPNAVHLGDDNYVITWGSSGPTSGKTLLIKDQVNTGLFRIDADGTLHIRSGAGIVADL